MSALETGADPGVERGRRLDDSFGSRLDRVAAVALPSIFSSSLRFISRVLRRMITRMPMMAATAATTPIQVNAVDNFSPDVSDVLLPGVVFPGGIEGGVDCEAGRALIGPSSKSISVILPSLSESEYCLCRRPCGAPTPRGMPPRRLVFPTRSRMALPGTRLVLISASNTDG